MNIQKLRDMNLNAVADELEQLRKFKAEVEQHPAAQEPAAYAVLADNGNIRVWCVDRVQAETLRQRYGVELQPLYTAPQPTEQHPAVSVPDLPHGFNHSAYNRHTGEWVYLNHANTWQMFQGPVAAAPPHSQQSVVKIISKLVEHIERETCLHEETHRGGAIWEVCNSCGDKWADDRGGKPEFKWPSYVDDARELLATDRCPSHESEQGDSND